MLRGRSALASVGAIVTVLSAIIDPFAQQLVQYYSCPQISLSQNASIPISNMWANQASQRGGAGVGAQSLGYDMQAAILSGLLANANLDSSFSCLTGNCTFPDVYYTLGYCAACDDVTDEMVYVASETGTVTETQAMAKTVDATTSVVTSFATWVVHGSTLTTTFTGNATKTVADVTGTTQTGFAVAVETAINQNMAHLPSGLEAGEGQQFVMKASGDNNVLFGNSNANKSNFIQNYTWPINMEIMLAAPFDTTHAKNVPNNSDTLWSDRGYGAARCSLQPCVHGYNTSVEGGKIKETLVSTSYNNSWANQANLLAFIITRTACLTDPKQIASLEQQSGLSRDKWPPYLPYNPGWNGNNASLFPDHDPNMPADCAFSISAAGWDATLRFFQEWFTGSISVQQGTATSKMQQDAFYRGGNVTFNTVNGMVQNMTRAMSNVMRQGNGARSAFGQTTVQATCVHADWRWLSFPAVLTGLTLVCFLLTSIVTHRRAGDELRAHDFKTAVLPLMFAASKLQEPPKDVQCSGVQSKIEKSVKQRHVRFERGDDGWHFTEQPANLPL